MYVTKMVCRSVVLKVPVFAIASILHEIGPTFGLVEITYLFLGHVVATCFGGHPTALHGKDIPVRRELVVRAF